MDRRDSPYHFVTSRTRTHVAWWDNEKRQWRVACGLWSPRGAKVFLDKPLCKKCDSLTRQTTTEDDRTIWKDSRR